MLDYQYADITRLTGDSNWVYTTQGQRLLSSLAKFYQRRMKFGGRERTLHLYRESDKLGKVYEVIDRKVVTTGTYYSYPPKLAGAKKHVLFRLRDLASLLQIRPGSGSSGVISKRCKQGDFYDGRVKPFVCPVCGGNGQVPAGFYSQTTGRWSSSSTASEVCRSCQGTGVVWRKA